MATRVDPDEQSKKKMIHRLAGRRSKMVKIVNPDAAGIDIGSEELYVCIPRETGMRSR